MTDETLGDLIATFGSIDHDEIEWSTVRRASYVIHQDFRYDYPGPIQNLHQRLMVVPPDWHADQRLITNRLRVSGCNVELERSYDTFGNVILDVNVPHIESDVAFTAWIAVEREAAADERECVAADKRLLGASRLTRPDDVLRAAADELRASGAAGEELAETISNAVHAHFTYAFGTTTVQSTAAQAWAGGVGVCQDYTHCMLALCRLCGLAAQYVSGHLLGEGGTHAWVEVLLPAGEDSDLRYRLALDPTHGRRCDLRYVTVGVGRDYGDVPPTSGTFEAPYPGELHTYKRAAVTRVEYLHERRRPH